VQHRNGTCFRGDIRPRDVSDGCRLQLQSDQQFSVCESRTFSFKTLKVRSPSLILAPHTANCSCNGAIASQTELQLQLLLVALYERWASPLLYLHLYLRRSIATGVVPPPPLCTIVSCFPVLRFQSPHNDSGNQYELVCINNNNNNNNNRTNRLG